MLGTALAGVTSMAAYAAGTMAETLPPGRDAEIVAPELPAASVTIKPSDLGIAQTGVPSGQNPVSPVDIELRTGSVAPMAPAGSGAPAAPAPVAPSEPLPQQPVPADVSTPGVPAAASPETRPGATQAPVAVDAPAFDTEALHRALDAFVGVEPTASAAGHPPSPEWLRFKQRQDLAALYAARAYVPFWIENGRFNIQARSVLSRIDHAAEDGLDLRAFPVAVPRGADLAGLVASELGLTQAVVAYGNQATGGRVDPTKLGPLIDSKPDVADAARVLAAVSGGSDAGEALHAFNPPQKGYLLLRAKLAELRQKADVASQVPIPYGPVLKPGMRDVRVPLIRTRFGLDIPASDVAEDRLVYDNRVVAAITDFQRSHHLPPSGVLTIRTIAAMSGGNPRRLETEILTNMERWRWLPRELGQDYIQVNIPDYTLDVMHGDTLFHHTRVVVGQPDKPTPVFSETMRFIIVNPYWNVPLSIVKKEMMPKLADDPAYFANHGYETVERNGITYVRQPPGETNALGRIKFMFPNRFSVYLHDTNARALFGKEQRALSHGCVRVEAPFKLAEVVLGAQNGWTESRVKKLIGGNERTINLPAPLPLHIVYFTAFVDPKGSLQLRDDVYGYSAKLRAAMGLDT